MSAAAIDSTLDFLNKIFNILDSKDFDRNYDVEEFEYEIWKKRKNAVDKTSAEYKKECDEDDAYLADLIRRREESLAGNANDTARNASNIASDSQVAVQTQAQINSIHKKEEMYKFYWQYIKFNKRRLEEYRKLLAEGKVDPVPEENIVVDLFDFFKSFIIQNYTELQEKTFIEDLAAEIKEYCIVSGSKLVKVRLMSLISVKLKSSHISGYTEQEEDETNEENIKVRDAIGEVISWEVEDEIKQGLRKAVKAIPDLEMKRKGELMIVKNHTESIAMEMFEKLEKLEEAKGVPPGTYTKRLTRFLFIDGSTLQLTGCNVTSSTIHTKKLYSVDSVYTKDNAPDVSLINTPVLLYPSEQIQRVIASPSPNSMGSGQESTQGSTHGSTQGSTQRSITPEFTVLNKDPIEHYIEMSKRGKTIYILGGSQVTAGGGVDLGIEDNEARLYLRTTYNLVCNLLRSFYSLSMLDLILLSGVLITKTATYETIPEDKRDRIMVLLASCTNNPKCIRNGKTTETFHASQVDLFDPAVQLAYIDRYVLQLKYIFAFCKFIGYQHVIFDDRNVLYNSTPVYHMAKIMNLVCKSQKDLASITICCVNPHTYQAFANFN